MNTKASPARPEIALVESNDNLHVTVANKISKRPRLINPPGECNGEFSQETCLPSSIRGISPLDSSAHANSRRSSSSSRVVLVRSGAGGNSGVIVDSGSSRRRLALLVIYRVR